MSTVRVRARGTSTSSTTVVITPTTTVAKRPRALSIGLIASSVPLPLSPTLPDFASLPPLTLPTQEEDGFSKYGTDCQTDSVVPPLLRLPSELLLQIIRLLYTPSPTPPSAIPAPFPNKPNYKSNSSDKEPRAEPAFFALARTCTHLLAHVRDVLYEKVVLGSVKDLARFRRSLIPIYSYGYGRGVRESGSGIGKSVRQLAITCDTDAAYAYKNTSALVDAEAILGNANVVRHLRKLAVPSLFELRFLPPAEGGIEQVFVRSVNAVTHPSKSTITVDSSGTRVYPPLLRDTTHFCVAEPSTRGWVSPREILDSVFPSPSPSPAFTSVNSQYKLTHLHFARRADANAENDVAFVKDVQGIITSNSGSRFPELDSVVISVFAPEWMDSSSTESDEVDEPVGVAEKVDTPYEQYAKASHLWGLLDDLSGSLTPSDARLVIRVGRSDEWTEEWQTRSLPKAREDLGFWERCIVEERARERRVSGY
ncbi:hypothetical protein PC9H_007983 [Pleurotus ostreatus]|uniref:Uncharacterized protein n=1 Tax=Pleurotus ostreatus TaxID=5322 RepID=A0A8H6ZUK8_PLEOS|nr:uncharacterized protein PC9H_007983 [Pleurotus ostreatus]KAF7428751.1 hypothetical protein PC9H_007983 [Pleurotus ostreatus]KAJ8696957.1 hypothetical protein PTI98_006776 [Pleurotus ostreatus]